MIYENFMKQDKKETSKHENYNGQLVTVSTIDPPSKEKCMLYDFHDRKRETSVPQRRWLFLNFKSERNITWGRYIWNTEQCSYALKSIDSFPPSYTEYNGQNPFLNDWSSLKSLSVIMVILPESPGPDYERRQNAIYYN